MVLNETFDFLIASFSTFLTIVSVFLVAIVFFVVPSRVTKHSVSRTRVLSYAKYLTSPNTALN